MSGRITEIGRWQGFLLQLPLLVWLVVLWLLLWGHITVISVLTGVIVALVVTRLFYLPPVDLSGRFSVYWGLAFAWHFAVDLVRASVLVAWQAVDPRGVPVNSVLAVQLHTRSDLIMTLTAEAISLVPGSLVVEVDRERSLLYVHALGTPDDAAAERVRHSVLVVEERIVRTLGSEHDVWMINRERRAAGRPPLSLSARQRRYEDAQEAR
ncbi:Na+/H+ antiporter subunit E [Microbacteriaceae bacterium 4G12]